MLAGGSRRARGRSPGETTGRGREGSAAQGRLRGREQPREGGSRAQQHPQGSRRKLWGEQHQAPRGGSRFPQSPSVLGVRGLNTRGFRWTRGRFLPELSPLPTRSLPGDPTITSWRESAGCLPGQRSPSLGAGPAELRRRPLAPAPRTHPPPQQHPPGGGLRPLTSVGRVTEANQLQPAAGFPHARSQHPGCNALPVHNPISDTRESPPDTSSCLQTLADAPHHRVPCCRHPHTLSPWHPITRASRLPQLSPRALGRGSLG